MPSNSPESGPAHIGSVHGIPVIAITGRLDNLTAPRFDAQIAPLLAEKHPSILLDFSALTYLSSAGLRSLLDIVRHTNRRKGRTGLFAIPDPIAQALVVSGLEPLLDIYPDLESALAHAKA